MQLPLEGQTIFITGAARRLGRSFALTCALAGADLALHYHHSDAEAEALAAEIAALGRRASLYQADLASAFEVQLLAERVFQSQPVTGLINNASIFRQVPFAETSLQEWDANLALHMTTPFLLSQAFAAQLPAGHTGRIVNLVDWRALRPGGDHFAYSVSKAGLAALTQAMAVALAPRITVNALALGAVLPPSQGSPAPDLLRSVPAGRWAQPDEAPQALLFLLSGPAYITGEIIHLDGGRHLL